VGSGGDEYRRVGSRKEKMSSRFLIFIRDFFLLLVFSVLKFDSNCCFIQDDFLDRKKEIQNCI
jgi:hypothetical protein